MTDETPTASLGRRRQDVVLSIDWMFGKGQRFLTGKARVLHPSPVGRGKAGRKTSRVSCGTACSQAVGAACRRLTQADLASEMSDRYFTACKQAVPLAAPITLYPIVSARDQKISPLLRSGHNRRYRSARPPPLQAVERQYPDAPPRRPFAHRCRPASCKASARGNRSRLLG